MLLNIDNSERFDMELTSTPLSNMEENPESPRNEESLESFSVVEENPTGLGCNLAVKDRDETAATGLTPRIDFIREVDSSREQEMEIFCLMGVDADWFVTSILALNILGIS